MNTTTARRVTAAPPPPPPPLPEIVEISMPLATAQRLRDVLGFLSNPEPQGPTGGAVHDVWSALVGANVRNASVVSPFSSEKPGALRVNA